MSRYKPSDLATVTCLLAILLSACSPKESAPNGSSAEHAVSMYAAEVAEAANSFLQLIPAADRDSLQFPFVSPKRTQGRQTHETSSFCAVVAWCSQGWGLQLGDLNQEQLVAAHKMLNLALSAGGYQILRSVINYQRIIGELEDVSESETVRHALEHGHDHEAHSIFDLNTKQIPDSLFYPSLAGGGHPDNKGNAAVNWIWDPVQGVDGRWKQFQRYTIAIYGEPGSDEGWGFRFEGHHITVNMAFLKDQKSGEIQVFATPLFFGTFPMITPATPFAKDDPSQQWNWTKGQLMMHSVAHHLHQFWLAVPKDLRDKALIPPEFFPQGAPLVMDTPLPSMISVMETKVDPATIRTYPHIETTTDDLDKEAIWHLKQAYLYYVESMNSNIGKAYEERIEKALSPGQPMTLSWAGDSLENVGNRHYSYVIIESLLLEFLQSNQYLVQHNPKVSGNHLHSMLRDLSFDWIDPMKYHHEQDHLVH